MKLAELQEEVAVELEAIEAIVDELLALQEDIADREPTVREKTAAAAFLGQFYNWVENTLKRISLGRDCPCRVTRQGLDLCRTVTRATVPRINVKRSEFPESPGYRRRDTPRD